VGSEPLAVLLLTKGDCAFCDDAKEIFERLTGEFGLQVETMSLDTNEGIRVAEAVGLLFAPGIVVNGRVVSHGRPSERRLRRQLSQA
jgi:hypothetical protein